ncbi:unnamed protein product [Symbiodinium natans]|uniref:Uncharacterized protein n=1 Tax=Symbiodinium natans TaxID=878477 RepID=A0A812Q3E5_9DINO|nr:unnamed protein product [Symbiodinium natans]
MPLMAFRVLPGLFWLLGEAPAAPAASPPWLPAEDGAASLEMKWPPSRRARSNRVNVTVFLTDVHSFDEPEGQIAVYAFMKLWWRLPRHWTTGL